MSGLLCAATVALWVRSAFAPTLAVSWGNSSAAVGRTLSASHGELVLRTEWSHRPMALDENTRAMDVLLGRFDAPGFHRSRASWLPETLAGVRLPGTFGTHQETRASLAWPLLLFGSAGVWLAIRARRRPAEPGRCPRCDYDLTGNVSGVCPECGTKLAKPPAA
jgi:hypothetical protein